MPPTIEPWFGCSAAFILLRGSAVFIWRIVWVDWALLCSSCRFIGGDFSLSEKSNCSGGAGKGESMASLRPCAKDDDQLAPAHSMTSKHKSQFLQASKNLISIDRRGIQSPAAMYPSVILVIFSKSPSPIHALPTHYAQDCEQLVHEACGKSVVQLLQADTGQVCGPFPRYNSGQRAHTGQGPTVSFTIPTPFALCNCTHATVGRAPSQLYLCTTRAGLRPVHQCVDSWVHRISLPDLPDERVLRGVRGVSARLQAATQCSEQSSISDFLRHCQQCASLWPPILLQQP